MSMGERSYSVLYALPVQQPHVCGYSSCDIVVLDVNNPLVNTPLNKETCLHCEVGDFGMAIL